MLALQHHMNLFGVSIYTSIRYIYPTKTIPRDKVISINPTCIIITLRREKKISITQNFLTVASLDFIEN